MDLAAFHPVFIFLCLLQTAVGQVEPPANVTFHCHNMRNTLRWSYGKPSPGQRFKISIRATDNYKGDPEIWVNPPAPLEADLSFLSHPSNTYLLKVTAVNGQNESHAVPEDGIIFSYFKDAPYKNQNCFVDFPPVNVTAVDERKIRYSFTHPWLLYLQNLPPQPVKKHRKKKSHDEELSEDLPVFYYMVDIKDQRHHGKLHCMESVCEDTLVVNDAQKTHCLTFHGELQKMSVHSTKEYCVRPEEEASYLVLSGVAGGLFGLSMLALVLFMMYRKKTSPSTSLPSSMTITNKVKQWRSRDVQEPVYVPVVSPASPKLLLDGKEDTPTVTPAEDELRLPIGLPTEGEGVSDEVMEGNNVESEYMAGRSLEDGDELNSEEASFGYEKRQVLVNLAPGEDAEGYRG